MVKVTIKRMRGQTIEIELDELLDLSVYELKSLIEIECPELEADEQKLIYRGKILADDDTLGETGVKDGAKLVVVKPKKKKQANSPSQSQSQSQTSPPQSQPSQAQSQGNMPNLFANMNMNSANGGMPNMGQMQQQMMQNPEMMQQMMQNPMVRGMMENMMQNPDFLQSMFENNPQLRQILDSNPQIRHVLQDPDTLSQAMEAMSNPEVYQEMLRNQDRALANISNMPGGFNALSRMYNSVQAPMEDALMGMNSAESSTNISEVDRSQGPQSSAMPNPFGNSNTGNSNTGNSNTGNTSNAQPQRTQAPPAQNNFMNMFANMQRQQAQTGQQQAQGNPAQAQQQNPMNPMMNPFFQQMMRQQAQPAQVTPPENAREIWADQLSTLVAMGFDNEQENINALTQARGNVQLAVNILMTNRGLN